MKFLACLLCLALPLAAGTRAKFNDGWRFARFGPMPDGSTLAEPGGEQSPVTASSEEADKGNTAARALDGDPATRWCAANGRPGQTLAVDLGRVAAVESVTVLWEKPGGLDLALAVSSDGKTWQTLPPVARPAADTALQVITSTPEFRHVRFTISGSDETRWASIAEISFLGPDKQPVVPRAPPEIVRQSPSAPAFDDRSWRPLSLPHDWGIEGPFRLELDGATGKLPWAGIGWYRKTFTLPADAKDKRFYLDIDGAMSDSTIFLNGKSLGRKKKEAFQYRLVWDDVKYEPGELRVVSYKNGAKWAEEDRSTTGPAVKLLVQAEPKVGDGELVFLTLTVADEKDRLVPRSNQALRFEVGGAAEILAAGNGDATSHVTMHRATAMPAYNGLCQVILRRTGPGPVSFKVQADGLSAAEWSDPGR